MKQTRKVEKVVKKTKVKVKGKLSSPPVKQAVKRGKSSVVDQGKLVEVKTVSKTSKRNLKNKEKEVKSESPDVDTNEEPDTSKEIHESPSDDSHDDGGKKSSKKKNPYTLFVGNLPFTATPEEVRIHFEKAGRVKEVRLPLDKKTNKRRGFGYIQLKDRTSYEKALTLHNSHILGRKINVEYTTQGKKGGPKEEKIKKKTLKLRALTKKLKEEVKSQSISPGRDGKGKRSRRITKSSSKKSAK